MTETTNESEISSSQQRQDEFENDVGALEFEIPSISDFFGNFSRRLRGGDKKKEEIKDEKEVETTGDETTASLIESAVTSANANSVKTVQKVRPRSKWGLFKKGPEKETSDEDDMESLLGDYKDNTRPTISGNSSFFGIFSSKQKKTIPLYDASLHGPLTDAIPPNHYQVRRKYWIRDGCSLVYIAFNRKTLFDEYLVYEPALSEFELELLERLYIDLRDVLLLSDDDLESNRRQLILDSTYALIKSYNITISKVSLFKIDYYLSRNYLYWGRLTPLMEDPNIEDISCDGNDIPLFLFHIQETNIKTNIVFSEDALISLAIKLAQRTGKHISSASPIIDSTLTDGSRLQLTFGKEVTAHGTSFTIRKFRETPYTPVELLNVKTFTAYELAYFWLAIENAKSLVFIGGTASGKTTSLNAVSVFIPPLKKIITIEDTREITLYHENWLASVTRDTVSDVDTGIGMFALLKAALRQRPEYILVGEVRGEEAQILFQAMNIGHTTFSTMHAGGVDAAIYRLENEPLNVPRNMLQSLDIISIQKQVEVNGKNERRAQEIVEIAGIDPSTGNVLINSVFEYDPVSDTAKFTGRSHVLSSIAKAFGYTAEEVNEMMRERERILVAMQKQNIRTYVDVSKIVYVYYANRELIMKNINNLATILK